MKLLTFELKKIIFSKKFLFVTIAIMGAIAFLFLRNVSLQTYIKNEELQTIQSHIQTVYGNSMGHRRALEIDPDNEQEKNLLEISDQMKEPLYEQRNASTQNDWKTRLIFENDFLMLVTNYISEGEYYPLSEQEIEQTLAMNTKLLEENIAPEHGKYSIAFPNFMKQVIDLYTNIGAIIILLLLIGELITSEFEQQSIKLLFTQPKRKGSILFSKWLVTLPLYVSTMVVTLFMTTVTGSLFGRKGTFDYPVLIEKNNGIAFLTLSEYMMESLLLLTALTGMAVSLYLFVSLLIRHTLMAMGIFVILFMGGYALTDSILRSEFAWYNPFRNLFPQEVLLGQNDSLWYQGIPIMLVLTIIFYFLSHIKIKNAKIR